MKRLLPVLIASLGLGTAATASTVDYLPDMSNSTVTNDRFVLGSTPGYLVDAGPGHLDMIGATGPQTVFGSTTTTVTGENLFAPMLGTPPGPLPPGQRVYLGTHSSVNAGPPTVINLALEVGLYGNGAYQLLANQLGMPVADIPIWDGRLTFETQVLGMAYWEYDGFQYVGGSDPSNFKTSFDAVWTINDAPGTHLALANGTVIETGHYDFDGLVQTFSITNADNLGGPSELAISNLTWSATPGEYQTIAAMDPVYSSVEFIAAIPEPTTYAYMVCGVLLLAWGQRRRLNG